MPLDPLYSRACQRHAWGTRLGLTPPYPNPGSAPARRRQTDTNPKDIVPTTALRDLRWVT